MVHLRSMERRLWLGMRRSTWDDRLISGFIFGVQQKKEREGSMGRNAKHIVLSLWRMGSDFIEHTGENLLHSTEVRKEGLHIIMNL